MGASSSSARMLGWASLALGAVQVAVPAIVNRYIGVRSNADTDRTMRGVGLQELTVGAGILAAAKPAPWLWTRVVGDVGHLGLLGAVEGSIRDRERRDRALLAVAGIGLADLATAIALSRAARESRDITARATTTINRDPQTAYERWRAFERLPEFLFHVEEVRQLGGGRSRWTARAPGGTTVDWESEIVRDVPGQVIAWRSVDGSQVPNEGTVSFAPAPAGQGTEVTVQIQYELPGARVGRAIAMLFGEHPSQQLEDDLRRFKQTVETGEVVRSEGSPEGTRTQRQWFQEPARAASSRRR